MISAKVIADSINSLGKRIITLQLRYPRFFHAEVLTHRMFSRNSSSSRAIPVPKMIEDILLETAMPIHWGKNQPGMQAREEHNALIEVPYCHITEFDDGQTYGIYEDIVWTKVTPENAWISARDWAIKHAIAYHKAGYHKQIVNRLLEPFVHMNVIVTATEWDNFFELRLHADAQPEIKKLAEVMKRAIDESKPILLNNGEWHLPYISPSDKMSIKISQDLLKVSVARCARVSYLTHEGKTPEIEQDLKLYDKLVGSRPLHASPAEHQAMACDLETQMPSNFQGGWNQYRKFLERDFEVMTKYSRYSR